MELVNKDNELISTQQNENGEVVVNGRELHEFLEVNSNYTTWFKRMCEYGFSENVDYNNFWDDSKNGIVVTKEGSPQQMSRKGYQLNHALKLEAAKEIAMLQRSEKGKQARLYFIQLEKMWNSPEMVMQRALEFSKKQVEQLKVKTFCLENTIQEQKPKVLLAESIENSDDLILVKDLANILKQGGYDIGQNRLFEVLREQGYLIKSGTSRNTPTQRSMNMGLFRVVEGTRTSSEGIRITRTAKVTGKGQRYFVNKFLGDK